MKNNIRLSLLLIFVFIATILFGFVNKLTAVNLFTNPKSIVAMKTKIRSKESLILFFISNKVVYQESKKYKKNVINRVFK